MRRFGYAFIGFALASFMLPQPVFAASRVASSPSSPSSHGSDKARGQLADKDANKISDAFQPALDAASNNDRFNVIVTWSDTSTTATAKRDVGSFTVTHEYKIIHGFSG